MADKVRTYFHTHNPSDDLSREEVRILYKDDDYGDDFDIGGGKELDIGWTDHAEYRSDLRDVEPSLVNEIVRDYVDGHPNSRERRKVKLIKPGVGQAVVEVDMRHDPEEAGVITVMANRISRIASRVAMEFPTQDAYDKYIREHPKADKSNHTVVKTESNGKIHPTSKAPEWKQVLTGRSLSLAYGEGSDFKSLDIGTKKIIQGEIEKGNIGHFTFKGKGDTDTTTIFYNPKDKIAVDRAKKLKEHFESGGRNDVIQGLLLGYGKNNVDAFMKKQVEQMKKLPYYQKDENKTRPDEWVKETWDEAKKIMPDLDKFYKPDEKLRAASIVDKIAREFYAYDLNSRYDYWNTKVFNGELPSVPLRWSSLKNATGLIKAVHNRVTGKIEIKEIVMSDVFRRDDEKLDSVLLHEMCHGYVLAVLQSNDGHGWLFRSMVSKIEAKSGIKIGMKDDVRNEEISEDVKINEFVVIIVDKRDSGYILMQMVNRNSFTSSNEMWFNLISWYGKYDIWAVTSRDKKLYYKYPIRNKIKNSWYHVNNTESEEIIKNGVILRRNDAREGLKVASMITAANAEKEVEKLLLAFLKGTPFANKAYAVGGYVRDEVLGLEAKDLDIVVEIQGGAEKLTTFIYKNFPEKVSHPRQMGASYPIWEITFKEDVEFGGRVYETKGAIIQFADTQKEMFPDDTTRQRVVEYGTLAEDIERRDFTTNMLLKDLTTGELMDLTGVSVRDIQEGVLRGHPSVNFDKILSDDPLRMIRLVRFQVKYGWRVPMAVLKAVKRNAARIKIISSERIRDELIKIMKIGKLAQAVKMMKAIGLLDYVFPEVQALGKTQQDQSRGVHQEGDVLRHTLLVLQNSKPGVESQLAALLHDIGKPQAQEILEDKIKFLGHEDVGGEIAEGIMRRLKFDKEVVSRVRVMVENHMRPHHLTRGDAGPKALRKFIQDVGKELVEAVLDLAEADSLGNLPPKNEIPDLRDKIDKVSAPAARAEVLPLNGNEIQQILEIKPGKEVGEALKYLKDEKYEMALAGKEMTKDEAIDLMLVYKRNKLGVSP